MDKLSDSVQMDEMLDPVVTFTISIDAEGNVWNDTQTHGSTFGAVYKAFHTIKADVERQIAERRNCPFNPINGDVPAFKDELPPHANYIVTTHTIDGSGVKIQMYLDGVAETWIIYNLEQIDVLIDNLRAARDKLAVRNTP